LRRIIVGAALRGRPFLLPALMKMRGAPGGLGGPPLQVYLLKH
jgi:hypothetical protein